MGPGAAAAGAAGAAGGVDTGGRAAGGRATVFGLGGGCGDDRWSLFRNAHTFPAVADTVPVMPDNLPFTVDHSGSEGSSG